MDDMELLSAIGHCLDGLNGTGPFPSVLLALFTGGLLGGFIHCSLMCGPFVLMQTAASLDKTKAQDMSELTRLKGALLIPYHLGRMTTYMALGGVMAVLIGGLAVWWKDIAAFVLALAGLLMILSIFTYRPSLLRGKGWVPGIKNLLPPVISGLVSFLTQPSTRKGEGYRTYLLGIILGLLPCGMVYAALLAASSTGIIWQGIAAMGVFALGTVPGLVTTALAGQVVLGRFRNRAGFLAKCGSAAAGLWLCFISASLLMV